MEILCGSEYKRVDPYYNHFDTTRTVVDNHALFIQAIHIGSLHGQNMQAFLINLTTSLTLLAMASTIVDFLACTLKSRETFLGLGAHKLEIEHEVFVFAI